MNRINTTPRPVILVPGIFILFLLINKDSSLANAGIQYYQIFPGFRVKPGMTDKVIIQRSLRIFLKAYSESLSPFPHSNGLIFPQEQEGACYKYG
jgi:hypothetical protein